jgi:hypothetical protein
MKSENHLRILAIPVRDGCDLMNVINWVTVPGSDGVINKNGRPQGRPFFGLVDTCCAFLA